MGHGSRDADDPAGQREPAALPPWPTPRLERVDPAALGELVARWRAEAPEALGLWVGAAGEGAHDVVAPLHSALQWLALARETPEGSHVAVAHDSALDLAPLRAWLSEPDAPYVVMHGSQATLHALQPADAVPDRVWAPTRRGDTEIAAHLLAAAGPRRRVELDLAHCVETVLGVRLGPGVASPGRRPTADLFGPNAAVAAAVAASALVPLMRRLTPMLRKTKLTRSYALETDLVPAVVAMERVGFGIDAAQFQRIAAQWARERREDPAPDRIARLDKLLSTYAHWPRDFARRGRIHCQLHPLAAESGRFSCTDPNLQQVPGEHTAPGLRACFVPEPGYRLIVADYAQIELRVAAHLAPCDAMRRVFAEGRDPHRATAATITGKPESQITARERKLAKAVNFGFLFGMGAKRFASYANRSFGVVVSDAEARRARQAFLDTYPGIAAWHTRVGALGRRGPVTVCTAMGRRKRFAPGRLSFNAALNIPVQGTAAEGFKLAMIRLHHALPAIGGRGVLVVHDEYIAEVPEAHADAGRALVRSAMEEAMASVVTRVPIVVEAEIATHWS